MGTSLTGLTPATTYDALIKTGDNAPIGATLKTLSDGLGNNLPMEVSTTSINFTGTLLQSGTAVPTQAQVNGKQDTLVSGTNIKTINGTSVLGSGNITTPTTSPGGSTGQVQFNNGGAFGASSALFWDNTNSRLGIGTSSPTAPLSISNSSSSILDWARVSGNSGYLAVTNIRTGGGQGTVFGIDSFSFRVGSTNYIVSESNRLGIGTNNDALTAQLQVKGSGSTSATTSLLVQNSAGTQMLKVQDDQKVYIGTTGYFVPDTQSTAWYNNYNKPIITSTEGSNIVKVLISNNTHSFLSSTSGINGQIGVNTNTPHSSSAVDIVSTTTGFLPPRMTSAQRTAISSPAVGLIVYQTDSTEGLYVNTSSGWKIATLS